MTKKPPVQNDQPGSQAITAAIPGLSEEPEIKAKEQESKYLDRFASEHRKHETFRDFLQRLIRGQIQRSMFPPPFGGFRAKKEQARLTAEHRRIYGPHAYIRYWKSVPPPPDE